MAAHSTIVIREFTTEVTFQGNPESDVVTVFGDRLRNTVKETPDALVDCSVLSRIRVTQRRSVGKPLWCQVVLQTKHRISSHPNTSAEEFLQGVIRVLDAVGHPATVRIVRAPGEVEDEYSDDDAGATPPPQETTQSQPDDDASDHTLALAASAAALAFFVAKSTATPLAVRLFD